jgi:superfamily I DNA/RNA helicase
VDAEGHLLITACPGSGKTPVLSYRAENLLKKSPIGNLMAVTFGSDAAGEIKSRIVKKSPGAKGRIGAGTFHALAMKQVKRAGISVNLLSEYEVRDVLKNILDKIEDAPDVKAVGNLFTLVQSSLRPHDHQILVGDEILMHVWKEYQKIKRDARKVDFSDLLVLAVKGMKDGSIKPYDVRWILADEAQDMDEIQHAWIQAHAENGAEITLCGDDDQSIFRFRAALGYEGMEQFKLTLNASSEVLPINYRCGSDILPAAAKLIEHNSPHRIDKPIQSGVDYKGVIHKPMHYPPVESKNMGEGEHQSVVEEILTRAYHSQFDWAVLARGNIALDFIERHLLEQDIRYSRKSGSFWDQYATRCQLSVLNYLTANNWFAFSLFINNFLGTDLVFDSRCNNLNSLYQLAKDDALKEKVKALIYYERLWQDLLFQGGIEKEEELLKDVHSFVITNMPPMPSKALEKHSSLIACANTILMKTKGKNLKERIFYRTSPTMNKGSAADTKRTKAQEEGVLFVSLMTLHGSKGLEFDNVWLFGCESETFTSPQKDGTMADIPEERRLFYVGMTRAKFNLHSSYTIEGGKKDALFLQEAGILEWEAKKEFGSNDVSLQKGSYILKNRTNQVSTNYVKPQQQ